MVSGGLAICSACISVSDSGHLRERRLLVVGIERSGHVEAEKAMRTSAMPLQCRKPSAQKQDVHLRLRCDCDDLVSRTAAVEIAIARLANSKICVAAHESRPAEVLDSLLPSPRFPVADRLTLRRNCVCASCACDVPRHEHTPSQDYTLHPATTTDIPLSHLPPRR